ncbi:MAG TPA: zinc ribbon domain-containing protein [Actinomycetota bacterium]|nr:zinc ribbon domain-containing protein [Actinomycetota bacterium]
MPVYEYVCLACEGRFERLQQLAGPDPDCPDCGSTRVRKQISVFAAARATASEGPGPRRSGGCACGGACACRS